MALQDWALPQIRAILPLDDEELKQVLSYTASLPEQKAAEHLHNLLGASPEALRFIDDFNTRRQESNGATGQTNGPEKTRYEPPPYPPPPRPSAMNGNAHDKIAFDGNMKAPPSLSTGEKSAPPTTDDKPTGYAPPPAPPSSSNNAVKPINYRHTNAVIEAARIRARDENDMQQHLQTLQFQYRIYNSDIEPEHETDYPCSCPIHRYQAAKWRRYGVQDQWSKAVMYPGEKAYTDSFNNSYSVGPNLFTSNPYRMRVVSPYGYWQKSAWGPQRPIAGYHAQSIQQTISLNNSLNQQAQKDIDAQEPRHDIWNDDAVSELLTNMSINEKRRSGAVDSKPKASDEKRASLAPSSDTLPDRPKPSKMTSFRKAIGIKSQEERTIDKTRKTVGRGQSLRDAIVAEEQGRWPDEQWRHIVAVYQEKVGMSGMIADLRARKPTQYLHLLRAGYFEPIPVAWADQLSNPLKFSIEAVSGWRGITPAWRGYEDTAEERLYWVLNHRVGSVGMRMKPDFISEMNMARDRMAKAVEPPPMYYSVNDTCHVQHTDAAGYSRQVMPAPFQAYDRPEQATDDTMILLDVSGSMDFDPVRPMYEQYLITHYVPSTQPKNKDVAKAIIRRFTDAMANHDHAFSGYDLVTFANHASYIGSINHQNLDRMWRNVRLGGGTRVMTGWQKVKEMHFQKHSASATHHPIYGWQTGPETPILRLLLLLDGEATDMDEFELDLLGLSWAHVTIFLIGVDGCPHHHRHANELQRISDVNHHVSFVDAQGNFPERFVTHELLKRHLGYDVSLREFEEMEDLPAYSE